MTAADKILAYLSLDGEERTTAQIRDNIDEKTSTVDAALSALSRRGHIVRVRMGAYRMATSADEASATNDDPRAEIPVGAAELLIAAWDDGDVTLKRGDVELLLSADERTRLLAHLQRAFGTTV